MLLTILCNCGGGNNTIVNEFVDTTDGLYGNEYLSQSGLDQLKIASLNNYGNTGRNIKVAVVDTGIDSGHEEFLEKTIFGVNFGESSAGFGVDLNGHGTHVASIIGANRDTVGMRGVAYDAILYDYKVANDSGSLTGLSGDSSQAAIYNQMVTDGIKVSNNSWGMSVYSPITSYSESYLRTIRSSTISAALKAINNGSIIVFAAGNSGGAQVDYNGGMGYLIPELSEAWLSVVSVDPNNVETAYTNRCGVANVICVTAPGGGDSQSSEGIYAAKTGGGYVRYSGTSMAAPHVTGLVAVLSQKFPSLTNTQIISRIKQTSSLADLTGYHGETLENDGEEVMQAIFGHGLVNQLAATSQIGSLHFTLDNNLFDGKKHNIETSKLIIPSYFPSSVVSAIRGDSFVLFDDFDGAKISVDGTEIFKEGISLEKPYILGYGMNPSFSGLTKRVNSSRKLIGTVDNFNIYYESSNQSLSMMPTDFWGDQIGLIAIPSFFESTHVKNIGFNQRMNKYLTLSSYSQFNTEGGLSINGKGFGLKWIPVGNTEISVNVAKVKSNINMSFINKAAMQLTNVNLMDVNLKSKLSPKVKFFGNLSRYGINEVFTTPGSYGLKNAFFRSQTYGIETSNNLGQRFSIGIYNEGSLEKGTVEVESAIGRSKHGEIYYTTRSYNVTNKPENFGIFVTGSMPFGKKVFKNGQINFSYQSLTSDFKEFGNLGASLFINF